MRGDTSTPPDARNTLTDKATDLYKGMTELEKRISALYSIDKELVGDDLDLGEPKRAPIYDIASILDDCLHRMGEIFNHVIVIEEAL